MGYFWRLGVLWEPEGLFRRMKCTAGIGGTLWYTDKGCRYFGGGGLETLQQTRGALQGAWDTVGGKGTKGTVGG